MKAYVNVNKVPFNKNQLSTQLNSGTDELNLVFASDKTAEKTYKAVVKEFMKNVDSKDTAGLFKARQDFDKVPAIKKLLDSQALGENAKKEIVLTVRKNANKYVSSLLPKGNQFLPTLAKETKMLEVIGNIASKEASNVGKAQIIQLVNEYPLLKYFIGSGLLGGGIVAGGAIVSSLD